MTTPVVVVSDSGSTAPAAPVAVTAGELDARLELLRTELSERIEHAMSEAIGARVAADDALIVAETAGEHAETAEETAAVAAVIAVAAAEEAAGDEPDADDGDQGDDGAASAVEAEDEAPRAPARRTSPPSSGTGERRTRSGYGARFLSGR